MIVTQISRQKKNENRFNIFIDDNFAFGIDGVDMLRYHLKEGEEITCEELNTIYSATLFANGREQALRYITFKARTEKEVRDKLKEDYDEDIIEHVIEFLQRYNYINDLEYAEKYIRERIHLKRDGRRKIVDALRMKGISSSVVNEIFERLLEDGEIDELDAAVSLLAKKLRNKDETDRKEKEKAFAALARRGYSFDLIKEAFAIYCEELN